ncbi:hypothetical protein Cs7R123_01230 [Catellatospora sp. TT07R-123]|uniref:hypothetical protein n=1 Tax=Catellatospora sp. TT07R-123 TaxID=2733863 RepID=UPI001B02E8F2|nr:hypothetical protein [Catellatospora sp. TT07R-123]GHJ42781.1 hypothetical protein Cs7R123_01230 [Catellatospora sp. TT07R-123]
MPDRMWSLAQFRFDEQIGAAEVYLDRGDGLAPMPRDEAIAYAHARGANLVASWPEADDQLPTCIVAKVSLPVRWEQVPLDTPEADERLWFQAPCGGRDFLVGSGNTFPGRMAAWCPDKAVFYNVSLDEMASMSEQARYFVAGFLAGNQPGHPVDGDGDAAESDLVAWQAATARFRRSGYWYGRWSTCEACGCVLLPDSADDRCHEHLA